MNQLAPRLVVAAFFFAFLVMLAAMQSDAAPPKEVEPSQAPAKEDLPTVKEARARAKLLHETFRTTLDVVHHQFYREDEGLPIPAFTLKSVFEELERSQKVELRWLAVNAEPMNVDHVAKSDFEKKAVQAIAAGQESYELAEGGVYRSVGAITLTSDCLKCHVPNRTSTRNRLAGLSISLRVKQE